MKKEIFGFKILFLFFISIALTDLFTLRFFENSDNGGINLGARRLKDANSVFSTLLEVIRGIGYRKKGEEISRRITEVFPRLGDLQSLSTHEKITALAVMIEKEIRYDESVFELPNVLQDKKANCLGYAQLVYVLGRALGLEVAIISAYLDHLSNLIKLYRDYIILDLTPIEGYYKSKVFSWEDNYTKVGSVWILKEGSPIEDGLRIIQLLDERGIIAVRYNSRGVSKVNASDRQEAINDFTRAIRFYPDFALAYYNRAVSQANLGLDREAISDYYRAIELNPCFALAYLGRGLMRYYALHQKEEALADFREALRLDPKLSEQFPKEILALLDK
ncbi:MAG: hypothetical protein NC818_05995 [Candidatus Omnitrophica bacterium]|nr:hypothetical protein [Candidatus Omnitrophota bacterium]